MVLKIKRIKCVLSAVSKINKKVILKSFRVKFSCLATIKACKEKHVQFYTIKAFLFSLDVNLNFSQQKHLSCVEPVGSDPTLSSLVKIRIKNSPEHAELSVLSEVWDSKFKT